MEQNTKLLSAKFHLFSATGNFSDFHGTDFSVERIRLASYKFYDKIRILRAFGLIFSQNQTFQRREQNFWVFEVLIILSLLTPNFCLPAKLRQTHFHEIDFVGAPHQDLFLSPSWVFQHPAAPAPIWVFSSRTSQKPPERPFWPILAVFAHFCTVFTEVSGFIRSVRFRLKCPISIESGHLPVFTPKNSKFEPFSVKKTIPFLIYTKSFGSLFS